MFDIKTMLTTALALLITMTFHELAHGAMALAMGDSTAKEQGRLTLNPLAHLDPMGTLSMLIFRFGWAKPVPINPYRFRQRKLGMILVSFAGAAMNLVIAALSVLLMSRLIAPTNQAYAFFVLLYQYNVFFAVFNLMPFPPLDGSKILFSFLPSDIERKVYAYERYFYMILVILLVSGALNRVLVPLAQRVMELLITWFY